MVAVVRTSSFVTTSINYKFFKENTPRVSEKSRNPRFTIEKVPNSNGAQITISDVKPTDAGTYWCGIEYPSLDMYRQLTVIVNGPPDPHDALLNMLSDVNTVTLTSGTEDNHSEYENITNIIKHMQDAIQLPPVINDSWLSWLKSLGQGWPAWFLTIIIPYVMIFFLLCTLILCVLIWLSNVLMKKMINSFTYVQVHANIADQNSTSLHIHDPDHYPSSDSDSDDIL